MSPQQESGFVSSGRSYTLLFSDRRHSLRDDSGELRCSAPAVTPAAAFIRWVFGASKFSSPPASPVASARAALEIMVGAPPLLVELTASPSGELIRDYLMARWRGVRPHVRAQTILRIPSVGGPMLNGRRFRAARTNITRARHEGLTCRELPGLERRRVLRELTHPESILDWSVDRWWVCEDRDGSAAGLALATVDQDWALLNFLIARRHTARYLLHTHMVFSLQACGVKYVTHRGPNALMMAPGIRYFQARLGYEIVNLQVSPRKLAQSSALA